MLQEELTADLRRLAAELDELGENENSSPPSFPSIQDFEPTSLLGCGGMGAVYVARQISLGRDVAVKVVPSCGALPEEARTVAQLHHPNIVQVFSAGGDAESAWFAMELVKGESADKHALSSIDEVARLGVAVGEALAYAHRCGILHRDVKPSNIFVGADGMVKLGDFGLACLASEGVKDNYEVLYDWADNIRLSPSPSLQGRGGDTSIENSGVQGNYSPPSQGGGGGGSIFTREWGEYVDDWYAHNAINRACRAWGEHAQLAQALSLVNTYGMMFRGQRQFIGGCQWHPFDHQRGYHPDAYFGGLYDAFRQKKYAFEAIRAQQTRQTQGDGGGSALFIAHEMTQSSPNDVTIFSNCDSVRLTALDGWKSATLPVVHDPEGVPNAPVVFKGFWDFWQARQLSYTQRSWQKVKLVAEGIVNGEVVIREEKMPARRSTKLRLYADEMGKKLVADGSDFIVVVAEVTDDEGHVRRQAREHVTFTVEGEGAIIGDASIMANPRVVEWGSAPILVRSTHTAGPIRIIARPTFEGIHAPTPDTLIIESRPSPIPSLAGKGGITSIDNLGGQGICSPPSQSGAKGGSAVSTEAERRRMLEEVERQQQDFGIQDVK